MAGWNSPRLVGTAKSLRMGFFAVALQLLGIASLVCSAREPASQTIDFNHDIRPLLSDNCFACHGQDENKRKAHLRLDNREGALQTLRSGNRAIVPGQHAASALWQRIAADEPGDVMPPLHTQKKLSAEQKNLLKRWIDQGAPWAEHWAFIKPTRPPLPTVRLTSWPRNSIDTFVLARLEVEGLHPAPEADRATLVRRLFLDLTGLPPSTQDVTLFLADTRPNAYEQLVDRLLASPHFGERLAVDWLDAARYGDSHGYNLDSGRTMHPWRDWVIDAFNKGMPFDQFTVEQMAGDLLPGATRDQIIATGFNRNHGINPEGGSIPEEYRTAYVVDRVNTMSTVWLGLTVGCAQCHDHKYDPITQQEYYQLYAFFNNIEESGVDGGRGNAAPFLLTPTPDQQVQLDALELELSKLKTELETARSVSVPDHPVALEAARAKEEVVRKEEKRPPDSTFHLPPSSFPMSMPSRKARLVIAAIPVGTCLFLVLIRLARRWLPFPLLLARGMRARRLWLAAMVLNLATVAGLTVVLGRSKPASERSPEQATEVQNITSTLDKKPLAPPSEDTLKAMREKLETLRSRASTMVMREMVPSRQTHVLIGGAYDKPGPLVVPGVPAILPPLPTNALRNRLGLARWLVSPDHPLTARVLVNHYWQMLFGHGLVRTPEDFGSQGERPRHAELLDWLAVEFRSSLHWDIKQLLRLLVCSATYRQSSSFSPDLLERDPENRLLARMTRFRLPAEFLRDQALAVSGLLNRELGGPSVCPYQPAGLWEELSKRADGFNWTAQVYIPSKEKDLYRRSLYTFWKRSCPPPSLALFDAPSREVCTVRRPRTNTPLQALVCLNEPGFVEATRKLAERMLAAGATAQDHATFGFQAVTCRQPAPDEMESLLALFHKQRAAFRANPAAARKLLAVGASPWEQRYDPADLAAWTLVAQVLLNLDEVLTRG